VSSTQDEARLRFEDRPVLVTAAVQTAGRGRSGRHWENAARALAASLALVPPFPRAAWPTIPLTAGLAARSVLGESLGLKWPNDVVDAAGNKVAGLLVESDHELVVIGIGVNLWWPDPPAGAAAVFGTDPGPGSGAVIAERWAADLIGRLSDGAGWGHAEYRAACVTIGSDVTWEPAGSGRAVDVDATGRLVVERAGGRTALGSGEVRMVRTATLPPASEEQV
jgi:BirA family biotin operon repressor/biotin-[acetyl-CoA-carboxylase] ligase